MYDDDFTFCDTCNRPFTPKFAGATTCWNCWKNTPAGKAWQARKDRERGGRSYYDSGGGFYKQRQEQAKSSAGASNGPEVRVEYRDLPGFDLAMCRLLLQLAHPDKHSGSDSSVKATQWLNDRLRELKGGRK